MPAKDPRRGYLVQTLRMGLLLLGIAIEPELKLIATIYTVLLLFGFSLVGLFALVDFLYILKDGERIEAMYTANASFAVLSIFLITKFQKVPSLRLGRRMLDDYQSPDFARIAEELFLKVVRRFRSVIIVIYFSVTILPLVITYTTDVKPGDNKSLIFPSWYPWNMRSPVGYFVTMIVQLLSVTSGYGIVASILSCLFCSIVCIFTHLKLFQRQLRRLYVVTLNAKLRNNSIHKHHSVIDDYDVHQTLTKLVEQHSVLMKFTGEAVIYFSLCSVIIAEAAFATSIFLITVFISISGEYLYKVKLISASIFVTIASFIYCFAGELLYEVNQNVKDIIYDCPWYTQDVKVKDTIYTFLLLSERKFELRAYKMSKVRLSFFLYLMRVCYSVIQVLNNS